MKPIALSLLLAASIACGATPARAAMTGADFLQADASYKSGFINGFVRGMYLACLDHLDTRKQICSFEPLLDATFDLTPDEVLEKFRVYLRNSAEARQKEAAEALVDLLRGMAPAPK
jgi:hypothetical protein